MSNPPPEKKHVVVVGGGAAGAIISRMLSSRLDRHKYNLILITPRSRYVYLPAALRLLVVPSTPMDSVFMQYDKLFIDGNGELRIGTAVSIEENEGGASAGQGKGGRVVLASGEKVDYDVLVLATGSIWEGPLAFPEGEEECKKHADTWRKRFEDAKSVVIAGGGAVGIETAGEIKDAFPEKKVTIVQGDQMLLSVIYPSSWRKDIEKRLRKRGIDMIFRDYVDGVPESGTAFVTRNGKELDADLVVPSRGGRPNTSFISSLQPTPLTERGLVKIEKTLQVQSHPAIFAAGDILDWREAKQFAKVKWHAPVVVDNILAYLEGKPTKKKYKGSPEIIIITNGKNGGAGYFGLLFGLRFGDWVSRMLKSKDLMVGATRKSLGLS